MTNKNDFNTVLDLHINLLNNAYENKDYLTIIEQSEKITKVAYALHLMENEN